MTRNLAHVLLGISCVVCPCVARAQPLVYERFEGSTVGTVNGNVTFGTDVIGYGGLVTFLVKDADWQATAKIVDAVQIPRIAPSLGGVESLIEQPLVMSYYDCSPEERQSYGIPDNMIRLSCGIENTEDLIADLQQALEA